MPKVRPVHLILLLAFAGALLVFLAATRSSVAAGSGERSLDASFEDIAQHSNNEDKDYFNAEDHDAIHTANGIMVFADKNDDGNIAFSELREVMQRFNEEVKPEEIVETFTKLDDDGDGLLNAEFVNLPKA